MARSRPERRPRIYFSLRSPYSWLTVHDLTTRHPEVAAALEWRPFWEPDEPGIRLLTEAGGRFVYTPMSKEKHLYVLSDVRRLTRRRGLPMRWPVDRDPCWEVAHLPYFVAVDHGLGPRYVAAVQRARWHEGRDIGDPAVITELAVGLGLPEEAVAGAAGDEKLRERGTRALLDVYEDGVFGVPFMVSGREKFWGLDRLPDFLAALGVPPESEGPGAPPGSGLLGAPPEPGALDLPPRAAGTISGVDLPAPAAEPDPHGTAPEFDPRGAPPVPDLDPHGTDQGHAGGCG